MFGKWLSVVLVVLNGMDSYCLYSPDFFLISFSTKRCQNLILNQDFKKVGFAIQNTHCGFLKMHPTVAKLIVNLSQNLLKICHLRHKLRIFLFRRKVMSRSQDIQVFVF